MRRELTESCGLFGVHGVRDAARMTYFGLYAQQHRGEESAGIVTAHGDTLHARVDMGLVIDVFDAAALDGLPGSAAIGHVRYGTAGGSDVRNAQPLVVDYAAGKIAVAHNGNLVEASQIRDEFEAHGSIFHTTTDTELIVHMLARPRNVMGEKEGFKYAMSALKGAFCLLMLTPEEMIAVRDPNGFRPLVLGRVRKSGWVVASETCALDLVKARYVREIEPGEILFIDRNGLRSERFCAESRVRPHHCVFEQVYFARPDSVVFGDVVHDVRVALGRHLAREHPVEADVVISVPDSGNSAAIGYARESGIPYDRGLIRNHYVGRTFINPRQSDRVTGADVKLNPVRSVIRGKRVVIIDDSIIRGTTSRGRIRMLRRAGAREIHMRVSCPPTRHPCFYGIDFPTTTELIAATHTVEEIRDELDLDSLGYLSIDGMLDSVSGDPDHYCTACWSGKYIVPVERHLGRFSRRRKK
ncbi:MAG TPA: amidophosphoribosyltransferase [Planctomycetota bacterium]|nr:amidophosphoribosyltransferase [Planctomycetota bacterium]HUV37990.1 amidophosphoribosyltransferase [Planctomycetota bacterium]